MLLQEDYLDTPFVSCPGKQNLAEFAETQLRHDYPVKYIQLLSKMAGDKVFEGWCGLDKDADQGKMVWQGYDPKPFEDTDVDIEISHCGKYLMTTARCELRD